MYKLCSKRVHRTLLLTWEWGIRSSKVNLFNRTSNPSLHRCISLCVIHHPPFFHHRYSILVQLEFMNFGNSISNHYWESFSEKLVTACGIFFSFTNSTRYLRLLFYSIYIIKKIKKNYTCLPPPFQMPIHLVECLMKLNQLISGESVDKWTSIINKKAISFSFQVLEKFSNFFFTFWTNQNNRKKS